MEDASSTFRPTWQQAVARGLYLGTLVAAVVVLLSVLATAVAGGIEPPTWTWALLAAGPPLAGALIAVPAGRRTGIQISAGGIRTFSAWPAADKAVAPWSRVVDMRAERRGGRTVVSVYLDSGDRMPLQAPYSGELFAADPRFEGKMFVLSSLWRSHRFGGLSG